MARVSPPSGQTARWIGRLVLVNSNS